MSRHPSSPARVRGRLGAFTLMEMLVATSIGSLILLVVAHLCFMSGRSFAAMYNYCSLDYASRQALDLMSKEIRQAHSLSNWTSASITLNDWDGTPLQYAWNAGPRTFVRVKNGQTRTLLTECDYLNFEIFQRTPIGGTYDQFPTASPATCKLVQVTWICSRRILGARLNTESVQSAKFVIRKQ